MAHVVRDSHGIASWSTAKRKLDVGRNRDRPIRTSKLSGSIAMPVSISGGQAPKVIGLAFRTIGTPWAKKLAQTDGKESYV